MAKPFRLDPVLRQKKRVEDERASRLAAAARSRDAAARRVDELTAETAALTDALATAGQEGASGAELSTQAEVAERSSRWAKAAAVQLTAEQAEVEQRRLALVRASQDRRLLERLREIRREEAARRGRRLEQGELDDLASVNQLWRRADAETSGPSREPAA